MPSNLLPSGNVPEESIGSPDSLTVRHLSHRVEVVEREADRIHPRVAAGACRIRAMLGHRFPHREAPCRSLLLSVIRAGTSAGGGGGGAPRIFDSTYFPRSTGEVRLAYDVSVRMLPWPNSPRLRAAIADT